MNDIFQGFESTTPPITLAAMEVGAPINTLSLAEEKRAEWFKQRWGKFTASEFHKLMTHEGKDELPKGAQTYAKKKAAEVLTEVVVDTYISAAMAWGIETEPQAVAAFIEATGFDVEKTGDDQEFVQMGENVGGTPDGIIPSINSGIEIKCPNSDTHLGYMAIQNGNDLKEIAPEYFWQVQGSMMLTGASSWFFVSYDPRFKDEKLRLHVAHIERDETAIEALQRRLELAIDYRDGEIARAMGTTLDCIKNAQRQALAAYAKERRHFQSVLDQLMDRVARLEKN